MQAHSRDVSSLSPAIHGFEEATADALRAGLEGGGLSRAQALHLARLAKDTPDFGALLEAGREAARIFADNQAHFWASIGVDWEPCPMNCRFCSHAEAWGLISERGELSRERIIALALGYDRAGARWITLRTTEFYGVDRLIDLAQAIVPHLTGAELWTNTGEFEPGDTERLHAAGFTGSYHAYRLREGEDTGVSPEDRMRTLRAIQDSPLALAALADPIGPEHTPEEIVDQMLLTRSLGAVLMGAMARVPVEGTPLGVIPQISDEEHARWIALSRMIGGRQAPAICAHPASEATVRAGANVVVVETGAIPRDQHETGEDWRGFSPAQAAELLSAAGYRVGWGGRGIEARSGS